ncbi:hypothetical protein HanXRQr2_Chr17g0815221 [Helianthus annuus]|uniref:Uncharacterized protein n=1 Tax=Helianthus annuus TaxID=4232 RepID=A0A251RS58_HELAN|nr:hypothetical protein HanXRQr2_Chr17g0815221 [Helianthus annuus]KAJ0429995.1 hypothetical protein HanHA300_Chr17g0663841 [Helianthus annuus]KAJ0434716.1 hypothetical protein HanIR_Chr17g0884871 [Helianthus annuus]
MDLLFSGSFNLQFHSFFLLLVVFLMDLMLIAIFKESNHLQIGYDIVERHENGHTEEPEVVE